MKVEMRNFKTLMLLLVILGARTAFAESGGHEEHAAIPWNSLIVPQIINLLLLVGGLTFALKGSVKSYFIGRAALFESARLSAEEARRKAEATHNEIKSRLLELENSSKSSLETAKSEATQLKAKLIGEAKTSASRLEEEANRSAGYELQKAMLALRTELLNKAMEVAEKEIALQVDAKTQDDLQSAFISRAEGMRA